MRLQINGKTEELEADLSVAALLQKMKLQPELVAVEVNEDIIKRAARETCRLKDGDVVEIVKMIAGGHA